MSKKNLCLFVFAGIILIFFSGIADSKLLFRDDFEGDTIGSPPRNFEEYKHPHNNASFKIEIVKDPQGKSGKVVHTFNYALYIPIASGRDNWSDWIWEWDWMWSEKGFPGTAFRITGNNYYHISPRDDNKNVGFWFWNGNWNQVGPLVGYDFGLNTWNRFQVTANGDNIILKIKRRDDPTPFSKIAPLLDVKDGNLKKGPLSVSGTNTDAWMDNFIVGEAETDLAFVVKSSEKLATKWGAIKKN